MTEPIAATDRQLREAIFHASRQAWAHYEAGSTDASGHYRAATRAVPGLRISVRVNRHKRTEISLSRASHQPILASDIERVAAAHQRVQGSALQIAYTEPRDAERRGAPVIWAVMHVTSDSAQPALLGR